MERDKYLRMLGGDLLFQSRNDSHQLYELTLKCTAAGCLLMVKAHGEGKFWICFTGGGSPEQVVEKFLKNLREGAVTWRVDKYRSTIGEN